MNDKNEELIVTPCISVCKTDPLTGYCYGCGRSNEDKVIWKDSNTTNNWKMNNLELLKNRLTGWQHDAFEKSYENKKKTGKSLIAQKIINSKL
tara:strand:+ start:80 stop:358 length:279 start_codon:yes stop_codon:yes gene_type:complete